MIPNPSTGNETITAWWWWLFLLLLVGTGDPMDPAQENPLRVEAPTQIVWTA